MSENLTGNVHVASGTGVWSRKQFDAFFGQLLLGERQMPNRAEPVTNQVAPKPTNPERDAWNAAVDAKKAAKRARKASRVD